MPGSGASSMAAAMAALPMRCSSPPLRFAVGDRVLCKTSATQWKRGTIVKLHYREEAWPAGRVAPYQIVLQSRILIFAPQDTDGLVRADKNCNLKRRRISGP